MNVDPTETTAPRHSQIAALLPGAYFHDAWSIPAADPGLDALGQFLRAARQTPRWVERLMALRNRIVGAFGLKNLGGLSTIDTRKPEADFRPGDRVGIFTLFSRSADEVLLRDKDKHLDVVVSVHKGAAAGDGAVLVTVTTVVHVHNLLGRLYMLPVTPAHRVIARAMVRAVGR
jgi:Protein of unknown function (DUF2867)